MKYVECPHCKKEDVKYGANICTGCKAEIIYGNTMTTLLLSFILIPIAGYWATIAGLEILLSKSVFKEIIQQIGDTVAFTIIITPWIVLGWKFNKRMYKERILFVREKKR
ncbi:hypothetical protein [Vibrio sp. McD22-P3]|uniref:hypothetical protein n=1 Tax=Vibrio sp. McD22-P3 TaxID=2724880 RepID=UPI001F307DE0|nr:hypothetical protein [Vibrio sp. McD22-P3]MCF4176897.1 hypothetical protein [Vibrio sp. McD22-P3]